MSHYHPANMSAQLENKLSDFMKAPVTGDLSEVPGIAASEDSAGQRALRGEGIASTHQLIAKYLSFKNEDVSAMEHSECFYQWLAEIGINSHRAGIVRSICKRTAIIYPDLYDESAYD